MKRFSSTSTFPISGWVRTAFVFGAIALGCVNAAAAPAPIYKCFDRNLGVLYTDLPCKDGERVDIRAGDADPSAVARLERVRDALDASSAQRIADDRRAALLRQFPNPVFAAGYDDTSVADAMEYAPYGYGYLAYPPAGHRRIADARRDRRSSRQTVVPNRMPQPAR